ncbi:MULTISPECIES: sigma-70 family RNA polymerase sigma factor [Bacillaceae]|uniref:Uncharacterized protein n=1 Tax=Alkalicoccobacillus plakortidis TaxID=444060 RepID=A0A9D5DW12_9BACI|nr:MULTISPECIES: sigma-70 family RNA polymerase sigma factor [Bacillaceae]KQL59146.1 hypothetical protein AN965_00475 [Alkalicoccobacillus plakortidis]
MEEPLEVLIQKAQKGEEEALAVLLTDHYDRVYRFLLKITFDPDYAAELTQETMTKAIIAIKSYKMKKAAFSTWLFQIATNVFIDKKRKKKHEDEYVRMQRLQWSMKEEPQTEWLDIQDVLMKLDRKKRIPLLLKHYYGYSYEEVGRICQIRIGTAKSRVNSAVDFIRKELKHDEGNRR